MADNIFEQATRLGLRFSTSQGSLAVEDIWTLPLTSERKASLDQLAVRFHEQLSRATTVSFVNDAVTVDPTIQLSFDIVKHIIYVKKTENKAATEAKARSEMKQKVLAILGQKEDEELSAKSKDELRSLLATL